MCLGEIDADSAEAEAADISGIDLYNVCSLVSNFNEFEKCDPVVLILKDYTKGQPV